MDRASSPPVVLESCRSLLRVVKWWIDPLERLSRATVFTVPREISFHLSGVMSTFSTLIVKHLAHLSTASIKDLRGGVSGSGYWLARRPLQDPAAGCRALTHIRASICGTMALKRSPCHLLHESWNVGSDGPAWRGGWLPLKEVGRGLNRGEVLGQGWEVGRVRTKGLAGARWGKKSQQLWKTQQRVGTVHGKQPPD